MVKMSKTTKRQQAVKWLSIPFTIIVILCGQASLNLFEYFKETRMKENIPLLHCINFFVLCGYALAIIPGMLFKYYIAFRVMVLATVTILISYVSLGLLTDCVLENDSNRFNNSQGDFLSFLVLCFFVILSFTAAFAGCLATYTCISLCTSNFPQSISMLLPIVIVVYFRVGAYFDNCIKNIFFTNSKLSTYLIFNGIFLGIIFLIAAFTVKISKVTHAIFKRFSPDKLGVIVFLFVAAIFIEVLFTSKLISKNWEMSFLVFILGILANLVSPYILMKLSKKEAKGLKALKLLTLGGDKVNDVELADCLKDKRFLTMCFLSSVVYGTTSTFIQNLKQSSASLEHFDQMENMENTAWISDLTSVLAGGLIYYFFHKFRDGYYFLTISLIFTTIGFFCATVSEYLNIYFLYNAAIFIGIGHGLCSVIVAQILLFGGGQLNFVINWGFVILCQFLGRSVCEIIFLVFNSAYKKKVDEQCIGSGCVIFTFCIFFFLCVLTLVFTVFMYFIQVLPKPFEETEKDNKISKKQKKKKKAKKKNGSRKQLILSTEGSADYYDGA